MKTNKEHQETIRLKRVESLEKLKMFYLTELVEDPIDGTSFDLSIINLIDYLIDGYEIKDF